MLLVILTVEKLLERFTKQNCIKANQKKFRIEQVIKRKAINYMLNGGAAIVVLIVGLIRKIHLYKMNYFLEL